MMCEECRYFVKYWWKDKKVRRCTNPDSVFRGQQRHGDDSCDKGVHWLGRNR